MAPRHNIVCLTTRREKRSNILASIILTSFERISLRRKKEKKKTPITTTALCRRRRLHLTALFAEGGKERKKRGEKARLALGLPSFISRRHSYIFAVSKKKEKKREKGTRCCLRAALRRRRRVGCLDRSARTWGGGEGKGETSIPLPSLTTSLLTCNSGCAWRGRKGRKEKKRGAPLLMLLSHAGLIPFLKSRYNLQRRQQKKRGKKTRKEKREQKLPTRFGGG